MLAVRNMRLRAVLDLVGRLEQGPVILRAYQGKVSQIEMKVVDPHLRRNPRVRTDRHTVFTMRIQCALVFLQR